MVQDILSNHCNHIYVMNHATPITDMYANLTTSKTTPIIFEKMALHTLSKIGWVVFVIVG